jgi:cell division topological specificity factor
VLSLFSKLFSNKDSQRAESKNSAKSRLQFVLIQDRAGLNNEEIALFKKEMIEVIERYFVIDHDGFDISYEREGETTTLLINSPIVTKKAERNKYGVNQNTQKENKKDINIQGDIPLKTLTLSEAQKLSNQVSKEALSHAKESDAKDNSITQNQTSETKLTLEVTNDAQGVEAIKDEVQTEAVAASDTIIQNSPVKLPRNKHAENR